MATPRYGLGRDWMEEYHKFIPICPPKEDYDDRNILYAVCVKARDHFLRPWSN